jgi:endonuclease-3
MLNKEKLIETYRRLAEANPRPDFESPKIFINKYKSLVSVMLSSQTRDEQTEKATKALFRLADNPQDMLKVDDAKILAAIRPVSFYNRKATYIKKMAQELIEWYGGEVPSTRDKLMRLTGIGRKSTDIILRFVYGKPTIAVDTHVHRVVNRLGVMKTFKADDTAVLLSNHTPEEYKMHAHEWLIVHGKEICKAVGKPKCAECGLKDLCDFYAKQPRGD